ncbi:MAG TPA: hypothetical protein VGJ05_17925 [Fimbriiglobus sp.]|jgi:hypothetical protein
MCYSAEASFGTAVALVPAGAYCVARALAVNRLLLPLAVVPLGLAIQQAFEGWVWLGLHGQKSDITTPALGFLFFALAFWPFWLSLQAAASEVRQAVRPWLWLWTLLALSWFPIHFFPLVADPSLLNVSEMHHSVRYDFPNLPVYRGIPRFWVRVAYLVTIVVPLAFGRSGIGFGWLGAGLLSGSAIVAALVFHYAFASVWCFFAALLSLFLVVVFRRLPPDRSVPDARVRVAVPNRRGDRSH